MGGLCQNCLFASSEASPTAQLAGNAPWLKAPAHSRSFFFVVVFLFLLILRMLFFMFKNTVFAFSARSALAVKDKRPNVARWLVNHLVEGCEVCIIFSCIAEPAATMSSDAFPFVRSLVSSKAEIHMQKFFFSVMHSQRHVTHPNTNTNHAHTQPSSIG